MFHKDKLSDTLAITMSKFCIDVCLLYVVLSSSSQGYEVLEPVPGSEFTEGKKEEEKKKEIEILRSCQFTEGLTSMQAGRCWIVSHSWIIFGL